MDKAIGGLRKTFATPKTVLPQKEIEVTIMAELQEVGLRW